MSQTLVVTGGAGFVGSALIKALLTDYPAAAIVYLCTQAADDLNGQEFSLRDDPFRARLGLS